MVKLAVAAAAVLLAFTPAAAQDVLGTGALDMGMLTRNNAETSAIHAQAKSRSESPRTSAREDGADRTCRELPQYRRVLGSDDARVRRLTTMCRQLGYR